MYRSFRGWGNRVFWGDWEVFLWIVVRMGGER